MSRRFSSLARIRERLDGYSPGLSTLMPEGRAKTADHGYNGERLGGLVNVPEEKAHREARTAAAPQEQKWRMGSA
jgi:hypothetical protein